MSRPQDSISWRVIIYLCPFLIAVSTACSDHRQSTVGPEGTDVPLVSVVDLYANLDSYDGRQVRVEGIVETGSDGFHVICWVRTPQRMGTISQRIVLADPSCWEPGSQNNRSGLATVTGTLHAGDVYMAGSYWGAQLAFPVIDWR